MFIEIDGHHVEIAAVSGLRDPIVEPGLGGRTGPLAIDLGMRQAFHRPEIE